MLSIDETIEKEKANAEKLRKIIETGYDGEISIESIFCDDTDAIKEAYERFENCAKEHEQRAEWLEELKDHRERECNHINETLYDKGYSDGYNKAIEYFVMLFKSKTSMENSLVDEIAEQLKEGEENEQR